MKLSKLTHAPLFWNDKNQCNCILGNIKVYKEGGYFHVYSFSKYKHAAYFKNRSKEDPYKSELDAKLDVQRMCNQTIVQSLGWLNNLQKNIIEEI